MGFGFFKASIDWRKSCLHLQMRGSEGAGWLRTNRFSHLAGWVPWWEMRSPCDHLCGRAVFFGFTFPFGAKPNAAY